MTDLADLGFKVDTKGLVKGERALDGLEKSGDRAERRSKTMSRAYLAAGAVVVAALTKSLAVAIKFEKAMAEVSTLVDTSTVSMTDLADSLKDVNAEFGGGLQQQATALYGIISAGAEAGAESTAILVQANKLAVGGIAELDNAAAGLSSVLNSYAASGLTAADASDSLFTAVKEGVTTIPELSISLGAVTSIAQASGLTFDELTASVATLTAGGIKTSEAVTGLKAALSGMVGVGAEGAKIAEELGIEMSQADIKSRGFAAVLQEIRDKTDGNVGTMKKLLGSMEGVNSVLILTNENGKKLNDTLSAMDEKAGATEAAFLKMSNTVSHQWKVLMGNVENAGETIGSEFTPYILDALIQVNALAAAANLFFNQFSEKTKLEGALVGVEVQISVTAQQMLLLSNEGLQTSERFKQLNTELFVLIAKARLAQNDLGITANVLKDVGAAADDAADDIDKITDALDAFGGAGRDIPQYSSWVDDATKATKKLKKETIEFESIDAFGGAGRQIPEYTSWIEDASDATDELAGDTEESVSEMSAVWDNFLENTQRQFGDFFGDTFKSVLMDGEFSFKEFTDSILGAFLDMLGQMAAAWAAEAIFGGGLGSANALFAGLGGKISGGVSALFGGGAATQAAPAIYSGTVGPAAAATIPSSGLSLGAGGASSAMISAGALAAIAIAGFAKQASNEAERAKISAEAMSADLVGAFATAETAFLGMADANTSFTQNLDHSTISAHSLATNTDLIALSMQSVGVATERGTNGLLKMTGSVEKVKAITEAYNSEAADGLQDQINKQAQILANMDDGVIRGYHMEEAMATVTAEFAQSALEAKGLLDTMNAIPTEITTTQTIKTVYESAEGGNGYASGTGGQFVSVPAGYPNDSYPVFLQSGEDFMVRTPGDKRAGAMPSGGGDSDQLLVDIKQEIKKASAIQTNAINANTRLLVKRETQIAMRELSHA